MGIDNIPTWTDLFEAEQDGADDSEVGRYSNYKHPSDYYIFGRRRIHKDWSTKQKRMPYTDVSKYPNATRIGSNYTNGATCWYKLGGVPQPASYNPLILHRENGPAKEWPGGAFAYYLDGRSYNEDQYIEAIKELQMTKKKTPVTTPPVAVATTDKFNRYVITNKEWATTYRPSDYFEKEFAGEGEIVVGEKNLALVLQAIQQEDELSLSDLQVYKLVPVEVEVIPASIKVK